MSERASHTNWQQSITGHKSNSGGRKGRKQAEKPTLTEQGIDVDESIRENHANIQRLREITPRNRTPEPTYRKVYETWLEQSKTGHPTERSIAKALGKSVSTIHHHITNLVRDGYLDKDTIREREYVLTGKPFNPSDREKRRNHRTRWPESVRKQSDSKNEGVAFDSAEYARIISERVGKSAKTVRNNFATLRKEGILPPAENPFASQSTPTPEPKPEPKPAANKEEPMSQTTTSKITADDIPTSKLTPTGIAVGTITVGPQDAAYTRAIIADALVGIYDSISALQRAAYHANDKVVYGFATKLMNGELMDIKANYSKENK